MSLTQSYTLIRNPSSESVPLREFFRRFVRTEGGHTMDIVISFESSSLRRDSKNPVIANFEAQYADRCGRPISPDTLDITRI